MEGALMSRVLPKKVTIREVGPRDGLQSEAPLPIEDRVRLIEAVSRTGVPKVEAVSFVSPRAVPAMAGAAQVWSQVAKVPRVAYSALVPNRYGAEAAVAAGGLRSLQAFLSASESYNRKNLGKSVWESIGDVAEVLWVGSEAGLLVEVTISAAFGDPFEGDVAPSRVVEIAEELAEVGATGISLGDTTGMATPTRVWDVVGLLRERLPEMRLNLHLHDTRGTAMANVLAALEEGVDEFDASVGGLGGSPFAPEGNGNVATEDLVHMLTDMGIETGVDLNRVLQAAALAEAFVGHPLASQVSKAGPRWAVARPKEAD
jgi:hydroxymethylglutaryl-CoA lyase